MSNEKIINHPLEIPFKDFMPGQIIQSGQFNDDMAEIEEKVNEVVEKHNTLTDETDNHVSNKENPHEVTAHQVGTYSEGEIDAYLDDIRNGGLYDKSIENRVLDDECIEARNIKNASITSIKVDSNFGSQINISKNIDITDRYTKKEVNDLLAQKVGEGTYSKEELDQMFEDVQAGQIVDGTIDVSKLKDNVGKNLDISANPSITDRYTKAEVNVLIQENGLPRDWGGLDEVVQKQHYGHLPVANVMTANEFVAPSTPVLDIDVKEVVEARGGYANLSDRLNSIGSQSGSNTNISNNVFSFDSYGAIGDGVADDTNAIKACIADASNIPYSTVTSSSGKTYAISDTIRFETALNIDLKGDLKYIGATDRPAVVVGSHNKTLKRINVNISVYNNKYSDFSDFTMDGIGDNINCGVKLLNIGESEINIRKSEKFTVGCQCISTNDRGFYFNNITTRTHSNFCEIEVTNYSTGWTNGNKFKSITFGKNSSLRGDTDIYGILVHSRDGSYKFNSNWFLDVTSEAQGADRTDGHKYTLVYLENCTTQVIEFSRIEKSGQNRFAYIGENAIDNKIVKSPLFLLTSSVVEYYSSEQEIKNTIVSNKRTFEDKMQHLVFDSGDLRKDYYLTAKGGNHASKQFYHTTYDNFTKDEFSSNKVTVGENYITWHNYARPYILLDTSVVKTYYLQVTNGLTSDDSDSYKLFYFLITKEGRYIPITDDTMSKYVLAVYPSMYCPKDFFMQSNSNHKGEQSSWITVSDEVAGIGFMINKIANFKVYTHDKVGNVLENYIKKDRFYLGTNCYVATDMDGSGTLSFTRM